MAIERHRGNIPTRWSPFFGIRGLQGDMNRLFSDFFGDTVGDELAVLRPAVDIIDGRDSITVKAELPGVEKGDVDISLENGVLTIRGEKKAETEEKSENRYYLERRVGSFVRSVTLPAAVKADKVKASFKDGVLTIHLPKAEEDKARRVKVEVG